jgi:Holliday junction resolvase
VPVEISVRAMDEAINTYNDTVDALICFGHMLTWNDSSRAYRAGSAYALGRRLDTSSANAIAKNGTVTPDLIAVVTPKYGIVGEAKPSFHGTVKEREDDLKQLMKYDDDLIGWPITGEKIEKSDVVLLVHYSRKGDAQDILGAATKDGKFNISRNFAAISFGRMTQAQEFMSLELFWGQLSDGSLQKRLRPLLVPLEKVRPLNPALMYDDPPPLPLLIQLAWDHVLNRLIPQEAFLSGKRGFEIKCSVQQVRDLLSETCGPPKSDARQPQIPRIDWVKQMFEMLVKMKLAEREKEPDTYKVFYHKKKLAFFVEKYVKIVTAKRHRIGRPRGKHRARVIRNHPELPGF